ncbi:MAG: CBS domain-containing protein [Methanomassiliicoccales archaeon]|nr:MAG: CBS domain-containing protein [Methanomassiliicoccales archaeon]
MVERKPKVEDYMVRDVQYIPCNYTVKQAIERLISTEFHGMPVCDDGILVGFITSKELLRAANRPDDLVFDIMRKGTYTVTPEMDLDDAARILFRYGLRNVPVIDPEGRLIGIISNLDIVRSHIERATPNKVAMIKNFLEAKHGITITVRRRVIPVEALRPTQHEVYADELLGRKEEIKRGLVEPLIVIDKGKYFVLVDGHHRALASKQMGVRQFSAFVLELSKDIDLGMEKVADELGLRTLDDVRIIEGSHHPLVEITTRLLKDEKKKIEDRVNGH